MTNRNIGGGTVTSLVSAHYDITKGSSRHRQRAKRNGLFSHPIFLLTSVVVTFVIVGKDQRELKSLTGTLLLMKLEQNMFFSDTLIFWIFILSF